MAERYEDVETGFHPRVLFWMALTVVWTVIAAWLWFAVDTYARIMIVVVAFAALGFLAVPLIFWALSGRQSPTGRPESFGEWLRHRFALWTGTIEGRDAAINALIAPAAAAITITVVGFIAWHIGSGAGSP